MWQQKLFAVLYHGMEMARLQQLLCISAEFHTLVIFLKVASGKAKAWKKHSFLEAVLVKDWLRSKVLVRAFSEY